MYDVHAGPSDLANHFQNGNHDLTVVAIASRPFGPRTPCDTLEELRLSSRSLPQKS